MRTNGNKTQRHTTMFYVLVNKMHIDTKIYMKFKLKCVTRIRVEKDIEYSKNQRQKARTHTHIVKGNMRRRKRTKESEQEREREKHAVEIKSFLKIFGMSVRERESESKLRNFIRLGILFFHFDEEEKSRSTMLQSNFKAEWNGRALDWME